MADPLLTECARADTGCLLLKHSGLSHPSLLLPAQESNMSVVVHRNVQDIQKFVLRVQGHSFLPSRTRQPQTRVTNVVLQWMQY